MFDRIDYQLREVVDLSFRIGKCAPDGHKPYGTTDRVIPPHPPEAIVLIQSPTLTRIVDLMV